MCPPTDIPGGPAGAPAAPSNAPARGAAIGRYIVLSLVGKGGMGEVYAAYDPELDRKVAIKLLRVEGEHAGASEGRVRLMREAQAIAELSHPNVVVVYDVGTFQEQVFMAMEFVDGHTVAYWMHAEARSWSEVLQVFGAAGAGLSAAHEKDLIHRDFKPDNVMLGADGHVRVMDFGLARVGAGRDRGSTAVPATPAMMNGAHAPAAAPDGATVNGTAAASSTSPALALAASSVMSTSAASASHGSPSPEIAAAIAALDAAGFDPDSTRALGSGIVPIESTLGSSRSLKIQLTQTGAMLGTPAYMSPEQFLGRATDARSDQFSFCVALYEALYGERPFAGNTLFGLTAAVTQGHVRAAPPGTEVPAGVREAVLRGLLVNPDDRWPSMQALLAELEAQNEAARPSPFAAQAEAKLAGVWEAPPADGRAVESTAKGEIRRAFLATGKRYAEAAFENAGRILDRYAQGWSAMYTDACEATHVRGEQSAEVLDLRMASLQESLDGLKALSRVFQSANAEVVENAVGAANALPSIERCADVKVLRAVMKPPEAPEIRAAVDRLRAALAEVRVSCSVGRLTEGLKAILPLEEEARRAGYSPLLAEILLELGKLHNERRASEAAATFLEEALWTAEVSRHDEVAAEAATTLVYVVGDSLNRFDAGEIWARHADAILRRVGGHDHLWGWLYNNRGAMRSKQGRLADALADQRRAIAAKEKAAGPDSPDVALSLGNIALDLEKMGDLKEAAVHAERAVRIIETGLGPDHPRAAILLSNYSEILNALGRFEEARAMSQRALAVIEGETDPDGMFVSFPLTALGLAYLGDGMAEEALPILERAAEIREARNLDPAVKAEVHFGLARALQGAGRDGQRALELAALARDEYGRAPAIPATAREMSHIDAWLARHTRLSA